MYIALTALTPDISYNVPIVHPHQCTNIVFGKLTVVPTKKLLSQFHFMIQVNEERDASGNLISGILYTDVNSIDEANARFEAGTLFPALNKGGIKENLPTPSDSLELVEESKVEESSEVASIPYSAPEMVEHKVIEPEMQILTETTQEPTPEVEEESVARVKKTEAEMLEMSMEELRNHGKMWDQKSRSRYTLIKEILAAQDNA